MRKFSPLMQQQQKGLLFYKGIPLVLFVLLWLGEVISIILFFNTVANENPDWSLFNGVLVATSCLACWYVLHISYITSYTDYDLFANQSPRRIQKLIRVVGPTTTKLLLMQSFCLSCLFLITGWTLFGSWFCLSTTDGTLITICSILLLCCGATNLIQGIANYQSNVDALRDYYAIGLGKNFTIPQNSHTRKLVEKIIQSIEENQRLSVDLLNEILHCDEQIHTATDALYREEYQQIKKELVANQQQIQLTLNTLQQQVTDICMKDAILTYKQSLVHMAVPSASCPGPLWSSIKHSSTSDTSQLVTEIKDYQAYLNDKLNAHIELTKKESTSTIEALAAKYQ